MRLPWNTDYAAVSASDISQDSEQEEKASFLRRYTPSTNPYVHGRNGAWMIYGTLLNISILFISITFFISSHARETGKNSLLKRTSFFSPILDRVNIPTRVQKINGTLFTPDEPSIARQDPNPKSDAIWEELELTRTIAITADDVRRLGKNPTTVAKFEDSFWHFGDDAYMAQIDVFHQLHCLNALRKLAYPDYYKYNNNTIRHPQLWYIHHGHCVDILMQNIMCNANTDLVTMQWMETQSHPFPDFSINHQCRDFDTLVKWRKENSVDIDMWVEMKKPQGVKEVPAPDQYYELFGRPGEQTTQLPG